MKNKKKHKTMSLLDYFDTTQTPQPIKTPDITPPPTPLPAEEDT